MILTIELVPKSSWINNVRAIVTKDQWDIIRNKVYDKAWYVCEICGDVGPKHPVECHEIWHYDDDKLIQKLDGMIALCPNCHMVKHMGLAQLQGRGEKSLKHFMKINSLNKKLAEKYIVESFDLWKKRSEKKWTLNLSHLEEYNIKLKKHM